MLGSTRSFGIYGASYKVNVLGPERSIEKLFEKKGVFPVKKRRTVVFLYYRLQQISQNNI